MKEAEDIKRQAQFINDLLDDRIRQIKIDTLKVVGDKTKQDWRAINKITLELHEDLKYKEVVRSNLSKLINEGCVTTRPSERDNDAPGTVKYKITEKGEQFLSNNN